MRILRALVALILFLIGLKLIFVVSVIFKLIIVGLMIAALVWLISNLLKKADQNP